MRRKQKIDKVRASRDGHEYHEAWTARKATQLLWPDSDLHAIAVEGLSPSDQAAAATAAVEVADLTFYEGERADFIGATRTTVAQFKYSIASQDKEFRAYQAKKTVIKFGKTYRSFKKKYGAEAVDAKLDFQLVTNQPISDSLLKAIQATATGANMKGDVKKQAAQFKAASGLSGKPLAAFARKLKIIGRSGSLPQAKEGLASLLIDWSATNDAIATARLGKLRELVRDKAGHAGHNRNLIRRTDVLSALRIGDPKDLLPCEAALVEVGNVVERAQLGEAVSLIRGLSKPLLIHATGGAGKTVFLDSLASKLTTDHEVVFFDCFGGGAYRSPEDARHLPKKGLIHIANTLAFRGLCDPMLPDSPDVQNLLRTFRRRLEQSLSTIARLTPGRRLAIFIDAIDNAAFAARQASEDSFPVKLLESLDTEPIAGVRLIVSCRSEKERRPRTYAKLEEFELYPFTKDETTAFLRERLASVSSTDINVAQARSGGNPRVLDYLVKAGRGLLDPSEVDKDIELDDLIQQRITDALSTARERGYEELHLSAFLAGLAVLPPPVPVEEYAIAHGMEPTAIESFASDLSPLLERTNQGLMFRDEPTETLVHARYAKSTDTLERVASNLLARQGESVYAARALPRLLHELDDTDRLFALAFDERMPSAITSVVGKRNIQYSRLKTATLHAALKADYNSLVRLLVELSTIAEVEQRGSEYIINHPDLVVAANDIDARRRLFEIRTNWPGTRHSRLAIVNLLSGDSAEATRHALANEEWIQHFRQTERKGDSDEPMPDRVDIATSSFFLLSEDRADEAADYLAGWRDWYVFKVAKIVFGYAHLAGLMKPPPVGRIEKFLYSLSSIGPLAAALSFHKLSETDRKSFCRKLAALCKKTANLALPPGYSLRDTHELEDGLRKSATIALSLGLSAEARAISLRARHDRPGIWSYDRRSGGQNDVFAYLFRVALIAAIKKVAIHEKDLLPKELASFCSRIPKASSGQDFRARAKEKLFKLPLKPRYDEKNERKVPQNAIRYEERQDYERFLNSRLEPLLALANAFSSALASSARSLDKSFIHLVDTWDKTRTERERHRDRPIDPFFQLLGLDAVLFILWSRSELKPQSVQRMLEVLHAHLPHASILVRIVAILAQRTSLHSIAGEQAIKARAMIEKEDDVAYRASLHGELGRAMLPASIDEASVYFREGLEQADAIGSSEYWFTNELLLFVSQMEGTELDECDFHALSNICELNMGGEPEKFCWGAYGRGMAKAAGIRGLAKLSRWDDRGNISLHNTLLTFLIGLLEARKIEAVDAICLNRLAEPAEYYFAGTKEFVDALRAQAKPKAEEVAELIAQFEDDNPRIASSDTIEILHQLAEDVLGKSDALTKHFSAARYRYEAAREGRNAGSGTSSYIQTQTSKKILRKLDIEHQERIAQIVQATDPADEASLVRAINEFNSLNGFNYELKGVLFAGLRSKVPFRARGQYVRNVANLPNLYFYWKFAELKDAKQAWASSTAALPDIYRGLARALLFAHVDDLVQDGRISGSGIKELSDLTGLPIPDLLLEVIKQFSRPDSAVAGSVWLAFATFICPKADAGQAQIALKRLLTSESVRIANTVVDGSWKPGAYPANDFTEIAAGLIWRRLGSPYADARWRAAHCIRRFAKFSRWEIVDKVMDTFKATIAGPFQAKELKFYYHHARLWLLIAVARSAIDHPAQIARYRELLLSVITERKMPHVLMRHFAAKALLACVDRGELTLGEHTLQIINLADKSPHERLQKEIRKTGSFYHGRPSSVPEPSFRFYLDHDFGKLDVDSLSRVFGKDYWEVDDLMSSIVQKIDPTMTRMYDDGGRDSPRRTSYEMTTGFQHYGQQLGWHALFITAATLLDAYPVTEDSWYDDPWKDWLSSYQLTRNDGLWISDGTDRAPYDTAVKLLERKKEELVITGEQKKITGLAGLDIRKGVGRELIIDGRWYSSDGIRIELSSALVPPPKAAKLAKKLAADKPKYVWLPVLRDGDDDELSYADKRDYIPWVVSPAGEVRLDEHDPYGTPVANRRPRLARKYIESCKLMKQDPFGRVWHNNRGVPWLRAEAWGRDENAREDGPLPGMRLHCKADLLKHVLNEHDCDLLLLFRLERYEKETYSRRSRYRYSVGVVRIDKLLKAKYFKGRTNFLHESDW